MKETIDAHFDKILELGVLVFIFVFACVMLAVFKGNEELSRWIENGAIIAILARAFGTGKPSTDPQNTTNGEK